MTSNVRDPTRSVTLRRKYSAEAYKRFRALKGLIRENVIDRDVLAIKQGGQHGVNAADLEVQQDPYFPTGARLPVHHFDFPDDPTKVDEFTKWVQHMVDQGILEATDNPAFGAVGGTTSAWQNLYIRQAYSKGLVHANYACEKIGIPVPDQTIEMMFRNPKHAEQVGLLYTRAYGELKGVSDAMAQQMRRTLAEGLAQGWGADKMAKELNGAVDGIGIKRARLIARTETVRAVNEASLTRYQGLGVERVGAQVEFVTAGDLRVCPICQSLNGSTMAIDKARGIIPVHPDCRCQWLPVPTGGKSRVKGVGPGSFPVTPPGLPGSPTPPPSGQPTTGPVTGPLPGDLSETDLAGRYKPNPDVDVPNFREATWVDDALDRVNNNDLDGFTLNADLTEYTEDKGYVVGVASHNYSKAGGIDRSAIERMYEQSQDVLDKYPNAVKIGAFSDDAGSDLIRVDLNVVVDDLEEAKNLGAELNQVGIWDAENGEFIATGGTGEPTVTSTEDILKVLDNVDSLHGVSTDGIITATTPSGNTVVFTGTGDEFVDGSADAWARLVEAGDVPDTADPLTAVRTKTLGETGIKGGVNAGNMRALFDAPDSDTPSAFLKYYDEDSLGTAHDAVAANRVIQELGGRAPDSAYLPEVNPETIGITGRGAKRGEQLILEGIPDVRNFEDAYDLADPMDLAEQLARGTIVGNSDMYRHNIMVDAAGHVWLVDNDIAMGFTSSTVSPNGEAAYGYLSRLDDHLERMGITDPEDRIKYFGHYLDSLKQFGDQLWEEQSFLTDLEPVTDMSNIGQTVTHIHENGRPWMSEDSIKYFVTSLGPDDSPYWDEAVARLGRP